MGVRAVPTGGRKVTSPTHPYPTLSNTMPGWCADAQDRVVAARNVGRLIPGEAGWVVRSCYECDSRLRRDVHLGFTCWKDTLTHKAEKEQIIQEVIYCSRLIRYYEEELLVIFHDLFYFFAPQNSRGDLTSGHKKIDAGRGWTNQQSHGSDRSLGSMTQYVVREGHTAGTRTETRPVLWEKSTEHAQ